MRKSTFLMISLLAASALTGGAEIDPGWIVAHGPTYAAQTGDSAYTNEAAILEWDANRVAGLTPATIAEIASLESDLTNAVAVAFGVMPPYAAGVQANYKTILRNQMKQARLDVENATTLPQLKAAQRTLNQRQEIINLVRELRAVKPDWRLSELQ